MYYFIVSLSSHNGMGISIWKQIQQLENKQIPYQVVHTPISIMLQNSLNIY